MLGLRRNDGEGAAIRAFKLFADIFSAGEQARAANPAVEADVLGHFRSDLFLLRCRCFGRLLFGRRRYGERQRASGAAGALADHRDWHGEARTASGACDDGGSRLSGGHGFPLTGVQTFGLD